MQPCRQRFSVGGRPDRPTGATATPRTLHHHRAPPRAGVAAVAPQPNRASRLDAKQRRHGWGATGFWRRFGTLLPVRADGSEQIQIRHSAAPRLAKRHRWALLPRPPIDLLL